jgi:hypothetical protein
LVPEGWKGAFGTSAVPLDEKSNRGARMGRALRAVYGDRASEFIERATAGPDPRKKDH